MNIAYLFSGHSRTWAYCYKQFFENIYKHAPGDIFIHTWDCVNSGFGAHWNTWSEELKQISSQKIDINGIVKAYSPIQCTIEKDIGLDYWLQKYPNIHPPYLGIKNLLYSQKKVFEMSKTHKIYDKYIATRLDINYVTNLNIDELQSDNYIVSNSAIHPRNMVFDFWSIGSLDHMETKSKYLDEIDRYWFTTDMYHYCYEHALHAYLCDNNFKIYRSNMQYNVPRINNMITAYN
jgi:hypothetical protein